MWIVTQLGEKDCLGASATDGGRKSLAHAHIKRLPADVCISNQKRESLAIAPCFDNWGARGPGFKSRRPDQLNQIRKNLTGKQLDCDVGCDVTLQIPSVEFLGLLVVLEQPQALSARFLPSASRFAAIRT
jgi:hypothetical protein